MRAPGRDVVKRPKRPEQPVTLASVEEAAEFMVYVVETYGEVYQPILNRLNAELEAMRPKSSLGEVPIPRTSAKVTQADIARAIRAMRAAGYADVRVLFENGAVIVEPVPKGSKAVSEIKREIIL